MKLLILFLIPFSLKVFSMECGDNTTVTGEYWAYKVPSEYKFNYFKFNPFFGGHSGTDVSLKYALKTKKIESVVDEILREKNKFPYSYLTIRKRLSYGLEISVSGYMLFDYDMLFVKNIEKIIHGLDDKIDLDRKKESDFWGDPEYYRPIRKSKFVSFSEKGMSWVHTSPNKKTGLENQRLRIDLHHNGSIELNGFFQEFKYILNETNVEYLEYREYMNNFMFFIGNGRQGLNGSSVTCSNFEALKEKVLNLINKYGFSLGHDKKFVSYENGLGNYNKLVKSTLHTVKDDRAKN